MERPIGFNLFTQGRGVDNHLVASTIVSAFEHLWSESWGPRLEYILSNTIEALLEVGQVSLLSAQRLLSDAVFRARIVRRVRNPVVRGFWLSEFESWPDRQKAEALAPVQNKLGRLFTSPLLRNILGQVKSTIDVGFMMDDSRILVANLSRGRLGEDKSDLLGSLLVAAFHLAAMQRAARPEENRPDFCLYVDELQSFTSRTFTSTLSEARKYRLSLVLAHQYLDQLSNSLQSAILGNAGTLISFGVGPEDAVRLSRSFEPYQPDALVSLDRGEILVRTLEGGRHTEPFRARVLPPGAARPGRREKLKALSREKYGRARAEIEDKLYRWWGME